MEATERADDELRALLERHPDAVVSAIDAGGLFVPVPPSIPIGEHRVPQARSALDLVIPEDRVKVIDAWASARSSGSGDRKSVAQGKRVSVRVDLGGRRIIKKKKTLKYVMSPARYTNNITI